MIHNKFCRKILGVKKSTNLAAIYGELGRIPMRIKRQIKMIKYWIKLINTPKNSYTNIVYTQLRQDADNNITYNGKNWATHIKNTLDHLGMSDIWINQDTLGIDIGPIEERIKDMYFQTWYSNINSSTRLRSYSLFKHTFTFEKYLDFIHDKTLRNTLSRFRLSSHNLQVELGRTNNTPKEHRICKNCNMNMIETEFHFLLVCPKYQHLRTTYFKKYYCHWPTLIKFQTLVSTSNKCTVKNIAKYIHHAYSIRTT